MFHYRPPIANRQLRIFIAAIVAIALHIGLIGLHVDRKPTRAPQLSLPRSVTVFLGQNAKPEKPVHTAAKVKKAEHIEEKNLTPDAPSEEYAMDPPAVLEKIERAVQSSKPLEKRTKPVNEPIDKKKQITLEKINPVTQQFTSGLKFIKPDNEGVGVSLPANEKAEYPDALAGEGVQQPGPLQMAYPRYRLNSPPAYPGLARKRGLEGKVVLHVLVNKEGRVDDLEIEVSSGFTLLDRAAEKAVRKWLFEPARKGAEKVTMWVRVPVSFKLKN